MSNQNKFQPNRFTGARVACLQSCPKVSADRHHRGVTLFSKFRQIDHLSTFSDAQNHGESEFRIVNSLRRLFHELKFKNRSKIVKNRTKNGFLVKTLQKLQENGEKHLGSGPPLTNLFLFESP